MIKYECHVSFYIHMYLKSMKHTNTQKTLMIDLERHFVLCGVESLSGAMEWILEWSEVRFGNLYRFVTNVPLCSMYFMLCVVDVLEIYIYPV